MCMSLVRGITWNTLFSNLLLKKKNSETNIYTQEIYWPLDSYQANYKFR